MAQLSSGATALKSQMCHLSVAVVLSFRSAIMCCRLLIPPLCLCTEASSDVDISRKPTSCCRSPARSPSTGRICNPEVGVCFSRQFSRSCYWSICQLRSPIGKIMSLVILCTVHRGGSFCKAVMSQAAQEWQLYWARHGQDLPATMSVFARWLSVRYVSVNVLGRERRSNIPDSSLLLPFWLRGKISTFLV